MNSGAGNGIYLEPSRPQVAEGGRPMKDQVAEGGRLKKGGAAEGDRTDRFSP